MTMGRDEQVLQILQEDGFARVPVLADRLAVSESTIRRILTRLEETGKINRTFGGAVPGARSNGDARPSTFEERQTVALVEKQTIARAAASLVQPGDTIFLGGGSTVGQMPRFLRSMPLQVVTNSLAIAAQFQDSAETEVLVTGGYLLPRHRLLTGPTTQEMLRQLHFTWAFVGAGGWTPEVLTDWNVMMADANHEALQRAQKGVALVDAGKFNRMHLALVCRVSDLYALITNPLPSADRGSISDTTHLIQAPVETAASSGVVLPCAATGGRTHAA